MNISGQIRYVHLMLFQLHLLHLNVFLVSTRNSFAHFLIKHQSSINYKHGSQDGDRLLESELSAIWGNSPQQVLRAAPWSWVYITKTPQVRVRKLRYPSSVWYLFRMHLPYAGVILLLFIFGTLDSIGVWFGEDQRTNTVSKDTECFEDIGPCLWNLMTVAHTI